jgi:hypothetical protein
MFANRLANLTDFVGLKRDEADAHLVNDESRKEDLTNSPDFFFSKGWGRERAESSFACTLGVGFVAGDASESLELILIVTVMILTERPALVQGFVQKNK